MLGVLLSLMPLECEVRPERSPARLTREVADIGVHGEVLLHVAGVVESLGTELTAVCIVTGVDADVATQVLCR